MLVIGSSIKKQGCLTRLIDVVNREANLLEDLIGFNRGRLGRGFDVLVLKERLVAGDFTFFGYTYMSGGRTGLPSDHDVLENARPAVHANLINSLGEASVQKLQRSFAASMALTGHERYVKIVPFIDHDANVGAAHQYPASKLGIRQLNLTKMKSFFVAAKVSGAIWEQANKTIIDVGTRPRYDLAYAADPRKRVMDYLSTA